MKIFLLLYYTGVLVNAVNGRRYIKTVKVRLDCANFHENKL